MQQAQQILQRAAERRDAVMQQLEQMNEVEVTVRNN